LRIVRLLILGGTVFLGRHVAADAIARGHDVTLFHRGRHGADLFPRAEHVLGDRAADLSALDGRSWDAAIDTSGYEPADVQASAERLAGAVDHLGFVSTCNVYPAWPSEPVSEESPVWTQGDDYGPKKAACERAAEEAMPGRVAHLRAGLLCGPHDNLFRLPWWVRRIARGGDVPAPGDPGRTVQLIDARDLARWSLDLAERGHAGVYNATAPAGRTTMADVLGAAVAVTGSGARLRWIPDDTLLESGCEPWTELPLWAPERGMPGTWRVDAARAHDAGLRCRPIEETVADVWAWLRDGGEQRLPDWFAENRPAEMPAERERRLLHTAR
jgi:nucleoside-diphosphate-sugar epimerase